MIHRMASLLSLFIILAVAHLIAGEKPSVHLTGNPGVDFFGNTVSTSMPLVLRVDTTVSLTTDQANLEKSPWLAGALSLAVPGLGEVYTQNYVKGAIFFAVDVAAWALAYNYNKKGDRQTDEFQAFANQHWSAVRYTNWTLDNIGVLTDGHSSRAEYENSVFNSDYDPDAPCGPPFRCVDWIELNKMEDTIGYYAPPRGNAYTHRLPYYGEQQYYELIGKYDEFSRGWDDADLSPITRDNLPLKSNSAEFYQYANMRAQANHYYDLAGTWVSVAVLNHVVSALDAYWSATKYNSALHAEVKMRMQPTLYGLVPVTEARIKYTF